jgi:hypothetical protein
MSDRTIKRPPKGRSGTGIVLIKWAEFINEYLLISPGIIIKTYYASIRERFFFPIITIKIRINSAGSH